MFSIILPTYNEKDNIVPLINAIIQIFSRFHNISYEIIIVDDNSPDGTSEEILKYFHNKKVKLITRKNDKGLATAIKDGILNSNGDYILIMDTDFSHPPDFIINLISAIKQDDIDCVIASRYVPGGIMNSNKIKFLLSKLMNLLIGKVLNLRIKDLTGGFFVIKKSLLNNLDYNKVFVGYGDYFYRIFYDLRDIKYSFKEIPFKYIGRKKGISKTNTIKMGIDYINTMFTLRFKNNSKKF